MTDPTKLRNQPSLTTSTGRIWLIVGGLFSAIALAVLVPMTTLRPAGVALAGALVVALAYAGMVVVQFTVRPGRRRLGLLASGMLLIAAVSLVCVTWVAASQYP